MSTTCDLSRKREGVARPLRVSRGLTLAVGASCVALGAVAFWLPLSLFKSLIGMVGLVLIASGLAKALQLVSAKLAGLCTLRSWLAIAFEVGVDLGLGLLLLNNGQFSAAVLALLLGVAFACEGLILLVFAWRSGTPRGRLVLALTGAATFAVGLSVAFGLVAEPITWVGLLVGVKLVGFGASLLLVGLTGAGESGRRSIYELGPIEPVAGELYAVYFGTAFHLGVYIGDGEVVHYLDDNFVHRASWQTYLDGRTPQHWTYPDLADVPAERVVATALAEVGKEYRYSFLKFNCEHFAIFCKSGGTTRSSRYAQVPLSVDTVARHPVVGLVAELNTRAVEFVAFHLGGAFGKRLSLAIRELGAAITNRLLGQSLAGAGR